MQSKQNDYIEWQLPVFHEKNSEIGKMCGKWLADKKLSVIILSGDDVIHKFHGVINFILNVFRIKIEIIALKTFAFPPSVDGAVTVETVLSIPCNVVTVHQP